MTRVCLAYVGGLTTRKGGGVASVIQNITRFCEGPTFTVVGVKYESEVVETRASYPSKARLSYIEPSDSLTGDFIRYAGVNVDDFDVVNFHNFPFGRDAPLLLNAKLAGKRLIYSHHVEMESMIGSSPLLGYYYLTFGRTASWWESIVANSEYIARSDLARFGGAKARTRVIRNGVDVQRVRATKPFSLDGDPSILFVGHLAKHKGIDILLSAFQTLLADAGSSSPRLHVLGSGELEPYCRDYVSRRSLGDKVTFWGEVDEPTALGVIRGADFFVLPSRHENAPISLLQAMAAGKPVVATGVGGIPELVSDQVNGLVTPPDAPRFAAALKRLCQDRSLAERCGRQNESSVLRFDWRRIAPSYAELYRGGAVSS